MTLRPTVIAFLLCASLPLYAQSPEAGGGTPRAFCGKETAGSHSSVPAAKIDSTKEADIRRLLDLLGTKALVEQTVEGMSKSVRPLMANSLPPGAYREKLIDLFFSKFTSKMQAQELLDLAIPSYDKTFSHEEILGLIRFYETPLGQKTIKILPTLAADLQERGSKWGEELGRQSMLEVLGEHPDLAQALTDAQKLASPPSK